MFWGVGQEGSFFKAAHRGPSSCRRYREKVRIRFGRGTWNRGFVLVATHCCQLLHIAALQSPREKSMSPDMYRGMCRGTQQKAEIEREGDP